MNGGGWKGCLQGRRVWASDAGRTCSSLVCDIHGDGPTTPGVAGSAGGRAAGEARRMDPSPDNYRRDIDQRFCLFRAKNSWALMPWRSSLLANAAGVSRLRSLNLKTALPTTESPIRCGRFFAFVHSCEWCSVTARIQAKDQDWYGIWPPKSRERWKFQSGQH